MLAQGYRVKDGKRAGAVEQITVAGNFYELLNRVVSVGSDLTFGLPGSSCVGAPRLWLASLDIAGE